MEQVIEKVFPKYLLERTGLDRYVQSDKSMRIIITYDPKKESGVLEVFEENFEKGAAKLDINV